MVLSRAFLRFAGTTLDHTKIAALELRIPVTLPGFSQGFSVFEKRKSPRLILRTYVPITCRHFSPLLGLISIFGFPNGNWIGLGRSFYSHGIPLYCLALSPRAGFTLTSNTLDG